MKKVKAKIKYEDARDEFWYPIWSQTTNEAWNKIETASSQTSTIMIEIMEEILNDIKKNHEIETSSYLPDHYRL